MSNLNLNNLQAVFFDLDGTLLDTASDLLVAFNYIIEKHGFAPVRLVDLMPLVSKGSKNIIRNLLKSEPSEGQLEEFKDEFIKAYHQLGHLHTNVFPGINKVIELLNNRNIAWGIITNKTESLALPVVKLFQQDLTNCQTIVCADTTNHAKPHPEPMLKACENLNVEPNNCLFIGDAKTDIEAGQAVGMQTILAAYGYVPHDEDITLWGANHIIYSLAELRLILEQAEAL